MLRTYVGINTIGMRTPPESALSVLTISIESHSFAGRPSTLIASSDGRLHILFPLRLRGFAFLVEVVL